MLGRRDTTTVHERERDERAERDIDIARLVHDETEQRDSAARHWPLADHERRQLAAQERRVADELGYTRPRSRVEVSPIRCPIPEDRAA